MSRAQRLSVLSAEVRDAQFEVAACIDRFGAAAKLAPYSYASATGLAAAQEELRRLRRLEDEQRQPEHLLAGDFGLDRRALMKRMASKDKANVLAAGPQDETFEIPGAFLNPAWVTRFTVEFSVDKETWRHPIPFFDGGRDPEAVQRIYLPPAPKPDKDSGDVSVDPFEARYLRIKPAPVEQLRVRRARGTKGADTEPATKPNWHHHVALRVGVEEVGNKTADEEVTFATAAGWRADKPEDYEVKYLRKSLGIRLAEDPIKLYGEAGSCPVVAVVAAGKDWPRGGDVLVAVGNEPVKGAPLALITSAIVEGRRPLTCRFMPREK
jgi:hypothetical protein